MVIHGQRLHRHCPVDGRHVGWALPTEPGCVALSDAGFVLALRTGFCRLDPADGAATDAEGSYRVAMDGGGQLLRFARDGRLLARLALPAPVAGQPETRFAG